MKKEGSGFDLPIAIGILGAYGACTSRTFPASCWWANLGSTAACAPSQGMLPIAIAARANDIRNLIFPAANAREAAVVEGVECLPRHIAAAKYVELLNSAASEHAAQAL